MNSKVYLMILFSFFMSACSERVSEIVVDQKDKDPICCTKIDGTDPDQLGKALLNDALSSPNEKMKDFLIGVSQAESNLYVAVSFLALGNKSSDSEIQSLIDVLTQLECKATAKVIDGNSDSEQVYQTIFAKDKCPVIASWSTYNQKSGLPGFFNQVRIDPNWLDKEKFGFHFQNLFRATKNKAVRLGSDTRTYMNVYAPQNINFESYTISNHGIPDNESDQSWVRFEGVTTLFEKKSLFVGPKHFINGVEVTEDEYSKYMF